MVDMPLHDLPENLSLAAVLFSVRDPGNAGTILRSADAAGGDAVVFSEASVDVYNPKAVRSSAGSVFHVPVVRDAGIAETVDAMRARGMAVYAMGTSGDARCTTSTSGSPRPSSSGTRRGGFPTRSLPWPTAWFGCRSRARPSRSTWPPPRPSSLFEAVRQRVAAAGSLEELIPGAAHDVRSPLTAVKGFVSTLSRRWGVLDDVSARPCWMRFRTTWTG